MSVIELSWTANNGTEKIELTRNDGGITCGAIEEASRSSKAINERVIINFRDKNATIVRFCD